MLNPYRGLLIFNFVVVVIVLALFRWITDRQIASLIAGGLFLLSPVLTLASEWRRRHTLRSFPAFTAGLFLVLAALPIFFLRVLNWGIPFDQLGLLGFTGPQLHQASNGFFLLMLAGLWWGSQRTKKASSETRS